MMELGHFRISGHSTKRKWGVYIFVGIPKNPFQKRILYVGKVGDNRAGCNPIISRVGNHFSFNKSHAQIRNAIHDTENYDYEYYYAHVDDYTSQDNSWKLLRDKVNEMERRINKMVQEKMDDDSSLLNPYKGNSVSTAERKRREALLSEEEVFKLERLSKWAVSDNGVYPWLN